MITRKIKRFMSIHRRNAIVKKIDRYMVEFHEAFENRNYHCDENGEKFVLQAIQKIMPVRTVIDAGANIGDWTEMASNIFTDSQIHSFEIVGETYRELVKNSGGKKHVVLNNVGLSDQIGEVDIYRSTQASQLATFINGVTESYHGLSTDRLRLPVTTGDRYCADNGIKEIDFLKIDVEGMEDYVLRGFTKLLNSGSIKVIQFEYGYANAMTKFLLKDFYDFLKPLDMVIGKIYPTYVDFREYQLTHENFLGPNFLAVHSSMKNVIEELGK